jgi:hypothetical protein
MTVWVSSEPRPRLAEGGQAAHGLADDLAVGLPLRVPAAEVLLLGAGPGDDLEGGVGDVVADDAADDDLGAAPDLDVVDHALVLIGQELGERVGGLVEVVVGVEDLEVQRSGRHGERLRCF